MSSRFNIVYVGAADEAADELEHAHRTTDLDELRRGLINALRRIAELERMVLNLREPCL